MTALTPIEITSEQVLSGRDTGMPQASRKPGESIAYQLAADAATKFKFKPNGSNLKIVERGTGRDLSSEVTTSTSDGALSITLNPGTGPWTAKATFYFDPKGNEKPAAGGLDPTIINHG